MPFVPWFSNLQIFTKEDGEFLIRNSALPAERIVAVAVGSCPHAAVREVNAFLSC